jgi:rare lipoprotein A (peptidoglycan hydrolase)
MSKRVFHQGLVGDVEVNFSIHFNWLPALYRRIATIVYIGLFSLLPNTPALAKASNAVASWYGPGFHGRRTASGERFNQHAMTAAHRTLPFGTLVRVTHKGRSVVVRINDRGPFIRGRSLDLSKGAARQIGCAGVCRVSMAVVGRRGRR